MSHYKLMRLRGKLHCAVNFVDDKEIAFASFCQVCRTDLAVLQNTDKTASVQHALVPRGYVVKLHCSGGRQKGERNQQNNRAILMLIT